MKRTEEEEWEKGAVKRLKDAYRAEMERTDGTDAKVDSAMEDAIKEAIGAWGHDKCLDLADEILSRVTEARKRAGRSGVVTEKQRGAWRHAVETLQKSDYWLAG